MSRKAKLWRVIAALWIVINVGGAVIAAASSEGMHLALHLGLLLVGYVGWLLVPGRREPETSPPLNDQRLEYLQQSVDALAFEVERIGEAQRFAAKVKAEQAAIESKRDK